MVDYEGCDQLYQRLCGCKQSPGVHRCSFARIREGFCSRPCTVMVDYEILFGDAQSGGYVGWGFSDYHKVSCGLDHILTLVRCAEIPSAHLKGMRQIFQDLGFKKMDDNTMMSIFKTCKHYKSLRFMFAHFAPWQWHLLGPLGPRRPQGPFQGLTQPETQRTISRNNEIPTAHKASHSKTLLFSFQKQEVVCGVAAGTTQVRLL